MRDYEYEHDSTYCYPESKVLKNKLNIKDASKLIEAERNITAIRILELKLEPPNGESSPNLCVNCFRHNMQEAA